MAAPAIAVAVVGGLLNVAGSLVGRVLIALGIGVVTVVGVGMSLDFAQAYLMQRFGGLRAEILQLAAALGVGEFLSIIFSALNARMLFNGLQPGGALRRWTKI